MTDKEREKEKERVIKAAEEYQRRLLKWMEDYAAAQKKKTD